MKKFELFFPLIIFILSFFGTNALYARYAVCVVQGMSGASIAVLVILSVFILIFTANWLFNKYLKNN